MVEPLNPQQFQHSSSLESDTDEDWTKLSGAVDVYTPVMFVIVTWTINSFSCVEELSRIGWLIDWAGFNVSTNTV